GVGAGALAEPGDGTLEPVSRFTATPSGTAAAPSPTASATPATHDILIYQRPGALPARTPRPKRTPGTAAENAHCTATLVDAAFAPTQGVWQDDPNFRTRTAPLLRDMHRATPSYRAPLEMVKGRPTVLTGAEFYQDDAPGGALHALGDRNHVLFTVRTDCATRRHVKVLFELTQHDSVAARFDAEAYPAELPVDPPRLPSGEKRTVTISIPVFHGFPGGETFSFTEGPWTLSAEIVKDNGARLGLRAEETGTAVSTSAPSTAFVPLSLTPSQGNFAVIAGEAAWHAEAFSKSVSDYLPLAPGAWHATVVPPLPLLSFESLPALGNGIATQDRLAASVADRLQVAAELAHAERVVGIVDDEDWPMLFTDPVDARETAGLAMLGRATLVRASQSPLADAHELLHTLPSFAWSSSGMLAECDRTTHARAGLARGLRLTSAGVAAVERRYYDDADDLLSRSAPGPEPDPFTWVNRCTYTHALKALSSHERAQRAILVRGVLVRQDDGVLRGGFASFYDVDAVPDLNPDKPGATRPADAWQIVVLGAKEKTLATYSFRPSWRYEDDPVPDRAEVPFAFHLPWSADIRAIELVAPWLKPDHRAIPADPPSIRITAPFNGASVRAHDGKTPVQWVGRGVATNGVYYSLLDSVDDGKTWLPIAIEVQTNHVEMPAAVGPHKVKVVITDGSASRETISSFTVR
ncbi:MAG TPA: hypothetical protein VMV18_07555, partial [bacterium]|nr:hypothetical protein [bacterium]